MTAPSLPQSLPVIDSTAVRPVTRNLELLLGLLSAFGPLSIDMYLPALPSIGEALGTTPEGLGRTLAAYFLGMGVGQLAAGPLLDRFGRLLPLRTGLVLYILGSALCTFAPGIDALVAGRAVQGLGGAIVLITPRAVVRDLRSGSEAARMLSRLVLVMGVAPIVAPLLGGLVLQTLGWRWIFGGLGAIALATLLVVPRFLPETAPARRPDRTLAGDLWSLVTDRSYVGYTLAVACASGALFGYIASAPTVFIELHGIPPDRFGWFFGVNSLAYVAGSQLNRRFLRLLPPERVLATASRLNATLGAVVLAVAATGVGGPWGIAAALFAFMGSLGCVTPNATAASLEHQGERAGLASAIQGATSSTMAAGVAWTVNATHDGSALPMGVAVAVAAALTALIVAGSAPRRSPQDVAGPTG